MSPYLRKIFWLGVGAIVGLFFVHFNFYQQRFAIEIRNYDDTFCVVYNIVVAENVNKSFTYEPITLAIHSTINLAGHLVEQANTFDDFISYSLLIEQKTQGLLPVVLKLWYCTENIRRKTSIHIVWERAIYQSTCKVDFLPEFDRNCTGFDKKRALPLMPPAVIIYPINYLRNVARLGAATKLHIVADVENIFCPNFTYLVRNETEKLMKSDEKYALVYRRFEIENGMRKPQNVKELWTLLRARKAIFFHSYYFPNGHYIPDLMDWLQYSTENEAVISTNEVYNNPAWEPQIIMKSEAPLHYEDVITRRYDHQVLIRELCRAGYKFKTLSHVFNIHVGIKRNFTGMDILLKHIARYGGVYGNKIFRKYLDAKYPETGGTCPYL